MKKWILSAVFMLTLSGFAAAQKIAALAKKEEPKKGTITRKGTETTIAKKEEDAAPVKLIIASPVIASTDAPPIKEK